MLDPQLKLPKHNYFNFIIRNYSIPISTINSFISTINCHGSFEIFINPLNVLLHLMIASLKKVKGKQLDH